MDVLSGTLFLMVEQVTEVAEALSLLMSDSEEGFEEGEVVALDFDLPVIFISFEEEVVALDLDLPVIFIVWGVLGRLPPVPKQRQPYS